MKVTADLHLHSRFSRAVSSQMNVSTIANWAVKKGIDLVATGDWTHPLWLRELEANLKENEEGIYRLKGSDKNSPGFILSTEISSVYLQSGKSHRIHYLVFAPNFEVIEKVNKELTKKGVNLLSDGRPILGMSVKVVAEVLWNIDKRIIIIPAHAWTPWFSLYGSISGFESIRECFGEFAENIFAIETGLSSDPAMNWRIGELNSKNIVSFSDAHSPAKLGREMTIFNLESLSFENLRNSLMNPQGISHTIEFYPEEGKYHYTGHRNCKIVYSPNDTRKRGITCPVCGKPLTVGVMSRVEYLAKKEIETESFIDEFGVRWIKSKDQNRAPYVMMVPLLEIISESLASGETSQKVLQIYDQLVNNFGSEYKVLLETALSELEKATYPKVVEGIKKVRLGDIQILPGYDGVYGVVKIWREEEHVSVPFDQGHLFD